MPLDNRGVRVPMGPELRQLGFRAASDFIFRNWPTHVITISSPNGEGPLMPSWFEGTALKLEFADTRNPADPSAPTRQHVRAIREYVHGLDARARILITCPGGYSRSAAVGVVVMICLGSSPRDAIQTVLADNQRASPNPVLLAVADEALDCRGALQQAWLDWVHDNGLVPEMFTPISARRKGRVRP